MARRSAALAVGLLVLSTALAGAGVSVAAPAPAKVSIADLGFDKKPAKAYQVAKGGAGLQARVSLVLRNLGPAEAGPVYYTLKVLAAYMELTSKPGTCKAGPGTEFHNSSGIALGPGYIASPNGNGELEVDCTIPKMPPHAVDPIVFVLRDLAQGTDFGEVDMSVFWGVGWGGPGTNGSDPNAANNQGQSDLIFCGPSATSPGCKSVATSKPSATTGSTTT
jgi:hypothetical protein